MVYKKLALRNKSLKQLSELDYLARSNNKKSVEGCYWNITREKSVIVSYFYSVLYVFLKINVNIINHNALRIYWQGLTQETYKY